MFKKLKNKLKEQKGMTLIELLAVIVILAIISAIAIPSILGLINNSKKDAHVANAQQMINSAKLAYSGDKDIQDDVTGGIKDATDPAGAVITLKTLVDDQYLEEMEDPDGGSYKDTSAVVIVNTSGKLTYMVYLDGSKKKIGTSADESGSGAVSEKSLKRSSVK
ncbi:prepilin-type N-terminal cleavage/methylation domain-containing protein [Neobacillus drentensis]|uniref:prepilin-type N-terminal cleavage/methylation domain-containing protein n=1 Tax=Neobacillus drentensis TaxID=220684 RepID=UPI000824A3CD|nr:prepilin-type N-terminal cleavage/methylation domain-containing protein [Neobacillus drentensis]